MPNARGKGGREYPHAWASMAAQSDLGREFDVEVSREFSAMAGSWEVDDPHVFVSIAGVGGVALDRGMPLSELDTFIAGLQEALAEARRHRMLPPPLSDEERLRRRRVAMELEARKGEEPPPAPPLRLER